MIIVPGRNDVIVTKRQLDSILATGFNPRTIGQEYKRLTPALQRSLTPNGGSSINTSRLLQEVTRAANLLTTKYRAEFEVLKTLRQGSYLRKTIYVSEGNGNYRVLSSGELSSLKTLFTQLSSELPAELTRFTEVVREIDLPQRQGASARVSAIIPDERSFKERLSLPHSTLNQGNAIVIRGDSSWLKKSFSEVIQPLIKEIQDKHNVRMIRRIDRVMRRLNRDGKYQVIDNQLVPMTESEKNRHEQRIREQEEHNARQEIRQAIRTKVAEILNDPEAKEIANKVRQISPYSWVAVNIKILDHTKGESRDPTREELEHLRRLARDLDAYQVSSQLGTSQLSQRARDLAEVTGYFNKGGTTLSLQEIRLGLGTRSQFGETTLSQILMNAAVEARDMQQRNENIRNQLQENIRKLREAKDNNTRFSKQYETRLKALKRDYAVLNQWFKKFLTSSKGNRSEAWQSVGGKQIKEQMTALHYGDNGIKDTAEKLIPVKQKLYLIEQELGRLQNVLKDFNSHGQSVESIEKFLRGGTSISSTASVDAYVLPKGKYKGYSFDQVDIQYIEWLAEGAWVTRKVGLEQELHRKYPYRETQRLKDFEQISDIARQYLESKEGLERLEKFYGQGFLNPDIAVRESDRNPRTPLSNEEQVFYWNRAKSEVRRNLSFDERVKRIHDRLKNRTLKPWEVEQNAGKKTLEALRSVSHDESKTYEVKQVEEYRHRNQKDILEKVKFRLASRLAHREEAKEILESYAKTLPDRTPEEAKREAERIVKSRWDREDTDKFGTGSQQSEEGWDTANNVRNRQISFNQEISEADQLIKRRTLEQKNKPLMWRFLKLIVPERLKDSIGESGTESSFWRLWNKIGPQLSERELKQAINVFTNVVQEMPGHREEANWTGNGIKIFSTDVIRSLFPALWETVTTGNYLSLLSTIEQRAQNATSSQELRELLNFLAYRFGLEGDSQFGKESFTDPESERTASIGRNQEGLPIVSTPLSQINSEKTNETVDPGNSLFYQLYNSIRDLLQGQLVMEGILPPSSYAETYPPDPPSPDLVKKNQEEENPDVISPRQVDRRLDREEADAETEAFNERMRNLPGYTYGGRQELLTNPKDLEASQSEVDDYRNSRNLPSVPDTTPVTSDLASRMREAWYRRRLDVEPVNQPWRSPTDPTSE